MKGIVFTELIDLVEDKFGLEVADKIIQASQLKSGGSYTNTGTYDHQEVLSLVTHLSQEVNVPVRDLVMVFGSHLAQVFANSYGGFFENTDLFSFLKAIDNHIHVEVKKLYPDAELPKFTYEEKGDHQLVLHYESTRPFADLAEGLILAVSQHFKEEIDLKTSQVDGQDASTHRIFEVTKKAA